jgi:hypothetical protein
MTTTPAQAAAPACNAKLFFEVRTSPSVRVSDPEKLEKALNAILNLDLGTEAERLIRTEVRSAIR